MNITPQMVEAGARALARHRWPTAIGVWDSFDQGMKDDYRDQARAALQAALPDPEPPVESCPTRLMDGRNEIRCWFEAGHAGKCI